MTHTLLFHINNEDPIVGEVEQMPGAGDTLIVVNNPRRKDGKDIIYLESNVMAVVLPIYRISFIEVIPSAVEEEIVSFVKD